ncbi:MAG: CoA-binding protein [SAR324 cluster bacterium]|nr:CoA-binding protein [SAR324 cluster bacterium]
MDKVKVTLDGVFSPRGVAVVGVSNQKLSFAEMVVHSLQQAEFPAIYPVNPKYDEIMGLPCFPRLQDIPGPVDHVVVSIPAELALQLLDDCTAKGVRSVHFYTAGFGESGVKEMIELEQQMLKKAREGGFRIIGPNSIGMFVPKTRVVNDVGIPLDPGPIAFLSQSGGYAYSLPDFSAKRGLRFSKVVSYGNALDVNESELLDYFAGDDETEIIGAYIEGVRDGDRFAASLAKAAALKPVIVFKGGRTEAGMRAAHGHTGSMTSSVDVFDAICRQRNVILVHGIEELIDVMVALRFVKTIPTGKKVALIGAGGGPSVLAGDQIEKEGLQMPPFPAALQDQLKEVLPVAGSILSNPLDTPNMATPEAITAGLKVLSGAADIDIIIYHLGFHPISKWGFGFFSSRERIQEIVDAMKAGMGTRKKALMLALRVPHTMEGMQEFLTAQEVFIENGLPVFHGMGDLAKAMHRVINWNNTKKI